MKEKKNRTQNTWTTTNQTNGPEHRDKIQIKINRTNKHKSNKSNDIHKSMINVTRRHWCYYYIISIFTLVNRQYSQRKKKCANTLHKIHIHKITSKLRINHGICGVSTQTAKHKKENEMITVKLFSYASFTN